MAIELPDELVWVMNLIGVNWPQVNEDKVREFAGHVRTFAGNIDSSHQAATATVRQLAEHYDADSYRQLAARWTAMSSDHLTEMIQICGAVAVALEVAADAVVAAKTAVLVELGVLAAEFVADQAAAVLTFGAAEAAEVVLIEATKRVVNGILQELEGQLVADLTAKAVAPLETVVERALRGLVFEGVDAALGGTSGGGGAGSYFQVHPEGMQQMAARLHAHADEVAGHADVMARATAGVSFG